MDTTPSRDLIVAREPAHGDVPPGFLYLGKPQDSPMGALFGALRRRKVTVVTTFVVGTGLAVVLTLLQPPRYTAQATIAIETGRGQFSDMQAIAANPQLDPTTVGTEMDVLRSDVIAEAVVRQLHLDALPEFVPPPSPRRARIVALLRDLGLQLPEPTAPVGQAAITAARDGLYKKIRIDNSGRSYVINITAETQDPDLSAAIATAQAESYLAFRRNQKLAALQRANQVFDGHLVDLRAKVFAADNDVQAYREANQLTGDRSGSPTGATSVPGQQMVQALQQLMTVAGERTLKEADLNQLLALQASGHIDDAPQIVSSPAIQRLRAQLSEVTAREATLSSIHGSDNPALMAVRAQRRDVQQTIAQEASKAVASLRSEVAAAKAKEDALRHTLNGFRSNLDHQDKVEVRLKELEAQAKAQRAVYEDTLLRAKRAAGEAEMQVPDATLISPATVPTVPSFPKKREIAAFAGLASLTFGVVLALLHERLQRGVRSTEELEFVTGLSVIGLIPRFRGSRHPAIARRRDVVFMAALHSLRQRLVMAGGKSRKQVVLVTSSVPGEGKTTTALGLAASLAESGGKALVVDCDVRRRGLARAVGRAVVDAHLSDSEPMPVQVRPNLDTITGSVDTSEHAEVPAATIRQILSRFRGSYDLVVLDAPPVLLASDALTLANYADCTLFVTQWENTPGQVVTQALRRLAEVDANVVGAVLTRVNLRQSVASGAGTEAFVYGKYGSYYAAARGASRAG